MQAFASRGTSQRLGALVMDRMLDPKSLPSSLLQLVLEYRQKFGTLGGRRSDTQANAAIEIADRLANLVAATVRPFARWTLSPYKLRKVTEHALANLENPVSLSALAAAGKMSPAHLCRSFRATTGLSPMSWLRLQRIERAMTILGANPETPLIGVALSVGYQSHSSFGAAFKRVTGLSPRQWLDQCSLEPDQLSSRG